MLTTCAGIRSNINADDSDAPSRVNDAHAVFQDLCGFFSAGIFITPRLVTNGVNGAVHALNFLFARAQTVLDPLVLLPQFKDLLDRSAWLKSIAVAPSSFAFSKRSGMLSTT